jgi:hypothetical protein
MAVREVIWYKDIVPLFRRDNLLRFFPTSSMSIVGQLNAVFRFCVYYASIMVILTQNLRHGIAVLAGALLTAAIRELAYKGGQVDIDELHGERIGNKCTPPIEDNPYMNLRVFDPSDKAPACKQWAMGTKSEDVMGEPIQDSPFQRPFNRFYTMPNTTATSSQSEFAHWLYGNMPSKAHDTADASDKSVTRQRR